MTQAGFSTSITADEVKLSAAAAEQMKNLVTGADEGIEIDLRWRRHVALASGVGERHLDQTLAVTDGVVNLREQRATPLCQAIDDDVHPKRPRVVVTVLQPWSEVVEQVAQ